PPAVAGRAAPRAWEAFVRAYDWADPSDPGDQYRELAIGAIEGTLRFLRREDLSRLDADVDWQLAAPSGLYPIAQPGGSEGGGPSSIVALAADEDRLVLIRQGKAPAEAGRTFGELVRYLALGWSARSDAEEDMIEALMLRARLRCETTSERAR